MALYLLPSLLLLMAKASAQPNFISHLCLYKTGNFTPKSTFKANLDHVLSSVTTNGILDNSFYRFSYGQNSDIANAVGLCRPDIKLDTCQSCLNDSVRLLTKRCPNQKEAIGWYENCSLHYSSSSALVQCLPDLTPQQCDDCLSSIFKKLPSCCSQSAGIFTPSCLVIYKPTRFFDSVTDDGPTSSSTVHESRAAGKKNGKNKVHIVIIMVLSVASCWILIICIYVFG